MPFSGFVQGQGPVVTLAGGVGAANGTAVDFGQSVSRVGFSIVGSSGVSAGAVTMQISVDGTNWVTPPTAAFTNNSAATLANPYTVTASSVAFFTLNTAVARYARVNVTTPIVGGAVSASITAA